MRIAIGGIAHETNTFSTVPTEYTDFRRIAGAELISGPGWSDILRDDLDVVPLFSAHATPSGKVTRRGFDQLLAELLDGLQAALPLDGVLLMLHGAMEVEEIGDGETAIIRAIRNACGNQVFITVTLDLHANLAPYVVDESAIITAYRTAPHRDAEETVLRGMRCMVDCLRRGIRPTSHMVKLPLLIGGEAAVTEVEPAKSRYAMLPDIDRRPGIITSSILIGCAWTDSIHTGVAAVVSGSDVGAIISAADELAESLWTKRSDFTIDSLTADIDESVRIALTKTVRPVFISDSGDNTTAGAAGDSPIFLQYLCERAVQDCLVAGITDPAAVEACRKAKIGEKVGLSLGGKLDTINSKPFVCEGVVRLISGANDSDPLDPRVLVRIGTVDVVLQSDRRPFTRLEHFTNLKIKPAKYEIIVVKEGYLFPELRDYAPFHIMALSPGFGDQRLERLPFKHLRRPIFPIDDLTSWRE